MRDPEEVCNWLQKAEEDFLGAVDLSRRRKHPLPDLVCFHCQQAAEKYLKAFLIFHEINFPKTHDLLLVTLLNDIEPQISFYRDWFDTLNAYSVQFRYPGDSVSQEEAVTALKTVKSIRKLFLELIPPEIFDPNKDE